MLDKNDDYNLDWDWAYPDTKVKNIDKMPDQKWHQIVSFIKSGIRIAGYGLLFYSVPIAAGVLILSEIIGIIEELV